MATPKKHHTITVYLDKDGYTAYFKEFPWISAGGNTEEEALKELSLALKTAKKSFGKEKSPAMFTLPLSSAHAAH